MHKNIFEGRGPGPGVCAALPRLLLWKKIVSRVCWKCKMLKCQLKISKCRPLIQFKENLNSKRLGTLFASSWMRFQAPFSPQLKKIIFVSCYECVECVWVVSEFVVILRRSGHVWDAREKETFGNVIDDWKRMQECEMRDCMGNVSDYRRMWRILCVKIVGEKVAWFYENVRYCKGMEVIVSDCFGLMKNVMIVFRKCDMGIGPLVPGV